MQVYNTIFNFLTQIGNQFNTTVKVVRPDNGTEINNVAKLFTHTFSHTFAPVAKLATVRVLLLKTGLYVSWT